MSKLGATGWSAIGRRYGIWYFWLLIVGLILIVAWIVWFVFWKLGFTSTQSIEYYILTALTILWILVFLGLAAVILWAFVKDLGHNFFAKWKTTGIGSAARGLISDLKTCGSALVNGIGNTAREYWGALKGGLKKLFGAL